MTTTKTFLPTHPMTTRLFQIMGKELSACLAAQPYGFDSGTYQALIDRQGLYFLPWGIAGPAGCGACPGHCPCLPVPGYYCCQPPCCACLCYSPRLNLGLPGGGTYFHCTCQALTTPEQFLFLRYACPTLPCACTTAPRRQLLSTYAIPCHTQAEGRRTATHSTIGTCAVAAACQCVLRAT